MNARQEGIRKAIEPLRQQIIHHPVYSALSTIEHLQIFMKYHVYAVWDFMSLLKALQNNLTCTTLPWVPKGNADTRYLINEIVCGEESDIDQLGNRKSHFELYLEAMQQCGAETGSIHQFIHTLNTTSNFEAAFKAANTPAAAQQFVSHTFKNISENKDHILAAVFTFGREDLIPNMFLSIINDFDKKLPDHISIFKYYLERHIEVDGGHHSLLALQMCANLCGNNEHLWSQAETAIIASLKKRIELWDGVFDAISRANR